MKSPGLNALVTFLLAAAASSAQADGHFWTSDRYPPDPPPSPSQGKTRAQVAAEVREARRLGLLDQRGEGNYPVSTPAQERQIAEAGLRAREMMARMDR